jgi:LacI family transcriptional regulator
MKVTINDIAKSAHVSKATVSRVINNMPYGVGKETRERILKIVEELNYQPSMIARSLVTKKTKSIGLIIPDITNPFFPQLVRGAEDYANKCGYHLFLSNSDNKSSKEKNYIKAFIEKGVDGLILASSASVEIQYSLLKGKNIHSVLVDRYINLSAYEAGVYVANNKGAYLATKMLLDNGHKKIVFINGPLSVMPSLERRKGFDMAFSEKQLEVDESLVFEGDYLMNSGYKITESLLNSGRSFSAIFCGNDMMAIGSMRALIKNSIKIPQEVEIIGYDNIELSQLIEPALTTVSQSGYEMGSKGAMLLIKLIEGKKIKTKDIILEPKLVLRGTTNNTYDFHLSQ